MPFEVNAMTTAISSQSILSSLRHSVVKLQSEIADRTKEVASGRFSDLGLTLGGGWGRLVSLKSENSTLQSMSDTNEIISTRLDTTQEKLKGIQASAQDLLNSLLASSTSDANAVTIQADGKSKLSTLVSELNSTLDGNFLFAGTNTGVRPITNYDATSSASKLAVDSAFFTTFGFSQSSLNVSAISGTALQSFLDTDFAALFQQPSWGETWSSAVDQQLTDRISPTSTETTSVGANATPFRELAQAYTMLADLGTQNLGADAFNAVTSTAGKLLHSAIAGLTDLRAYVGLVQSHITDANEQMSVQMSLLTTQVGNLENVDTYAATSRLTELQTQLSASYSLTAQLRDLSLVYYL
jgi:flagellar hook-associated protein 3 FlgL